MTEPPVPAADERADEPLPVPPAAPAAGHHFLVQAPVAAMDVDGFRVTTIGLVVFGVAAVVTGVLYPRLHAAGDGWWLGVCISGFALGWIGLAYCFYRRRQRRAGHWDRD